MTANHARKNVIRQRMAETGDTYTKAGRAVAVQSDPHPGDAADELRYDSLGGGGVEPCVFCGSTADPVGVEHVIPKWARRAFAIPGWLTLYSREVGAGDDREQGARLQYMNIVLKDALCRACTPQCLLVIYRNSEQFL